MVVPRRSLPQDAGRSAPTLVPIASRQTKRLKLLDAIVEAGCELLALATDARLALRASREPDAEHDRHLIAVRRLAIKGAEESVEVYRCDCALLFWRINAHALEAQKHDAVEDSLIGKSGGLCARLVVLARGLNRAITRELARRGGRR